MSESRKSVSKGQGEGKPAGYQPSFGRKLFMLALCILGLIVVWSYYFSHSQKP